MATKNSAARRGPAPAPPVALSRQERMEEFLGRGALGSRGKSFLELHRLAQQRLPTRVLERLETTLRVPREAVLDAVSMSMRTLARRKVEKVLSVEESDRVLRLARVAAQAAEVLGEAEAAATWLGQPNRSLGGATPLSLVRTDAGSEAVLDVLGRLEHGVYG